LRKKKRKHGNKPRILRFIGRYGKQRERDPDLKEESPSLYKKESGLHCLPSLHLSDDGADKVVDTALVLAADKTDEALLTPAGSPGVLDDPVLGAVLLTITDKKNTVVHTLRRARGIIDTARVEAPVGGINTDRERSVVVESSDHGVLVVVNEEPLAEVILDLALVELAGLVNTDIRIVRLRDHTDADSIGESIGHETTVAALIANLLSGARELHAVLLTVDKLLLRDKRKLLVGKEPCTLHVASGRESPAGTAVGLVLHFSDGTVINPVLLIRVGSEAVVGKSVTTRDLTDRHDAEVLGGELLLSKIGKLVKSEDTLALTVKVTNKSVVALESIVAGDVLLSIVVDLTMLDGPVDELLVNISSEDAANKKCNCNKNSLHCIN